MVVSVVCMQVVYGGVAVLTSEFSVASYQEITAPSLLCQCPDQATTLQLKVTGNLENGTPHLPLVV